MKQRREVFRLAFVPVPKDLTKVRTKVAFNLTKRQIICFGMGALLGLPSYFLTRPGLGNEGAALLMTGIMLPFFAFGIYEKDGQPLEKVLWNFINVSFLRPKGRPYRTDNGYAALMRQAAFDEEVGKVEGKAETAGKAGKGSAGGKKQIQKRKRGTWGNMPFSG